MTLLRLYWEFFKTGLFAIGGGMARLVWHWRSGAVTTVVFRRQNNQMRMTTRTGGTGAA